MRAAGVFHSCWAARLGSSPCICAVGSGETPVFLEMQQRKALAQELPVKAVALKHQKAVAVSMLLTAFIRRRGGGDPDVAGLAAKHYGFAPPSPCRRTVSPPSCCVSAACWQALPPTVLAPAARLLSAAYSSRRQAGLSTIFPALALASVSALRYGGPVRRRGRGGSLCDGARVPG